MRGILSPFKDNWPDRMTFFLGWLLDPPWVVGSRLPERFDRQRLWLPCSRHRKPPRSRGDSARNSRFGWFSAGPLPGWIR